MLGTPAEEGGGGKIILLDKGAFEDAKCSMMIHPGPLNVANPTFTTIPVSYTHLTLPTKRIV